MTSPSSNHTVVVHDPALRLATTIIGEKGLKNLGGRIQEEYLESLKSWKTLVDIYREMKDDITIATALDAIKLPILAADFDVERASDSAGDVAARDFLWDNMKGMRRQTWHSYINDALEMVDFGWAISEIVLEKRLDGRLWIRNLDPRGQETLERWDFDDHDEVTAFIQRDPDTGRQITIPIRKTIHLTFRGRKGNPQGKAILRDLHRTWRFIKELENMEAIGLERSVGGMPVAKLPEEPISEQDLIDLKETLRNLRMDEESYLIVPFDIELSSYSGSVNTSAFSSTIERKQKEMLMRVFAQFLKLGMDNVGTQALVAGSQDFFTLGLEAVQNDIVETLNQQLVPFLFRFNHFAGMTDLPRIKWLKPGKKDIAGLLEAYSKGVTSKVITPIKEDEELFRAEMDLPDLPEGEGEGPRGEDPAAGPQAGFGGPRFAGLDGPDFALDRCLLEEGDDTCCCPKCNDAAFSKEQ